MAPFDPATGRLPADAVTSLIGDRTRWVAITGVRAAAEFLLEVDVDREMDVFAPMLHGLLAMPHVSVWGPHDLDARTPTVAFTVGGHHPDEIATRLADARVAVWSGDYYALEVMASLGLSTTGGAVRAGVACYTDADDVAQLLDVVEELG